MKRYELFCKGPFPDGRGKECSVCGVAETFLRSFCHADHPDADDGHFSMTEQEWTGVYVEGDPDATADNIKTNYGARFV